MAVAPARAGSRPRSPAARGAGGAGARPTTRHTSCSRCAPTTTPARKLYEARGFETADRPPPLLPAGRRRRPRHAADPAGGGADASSTDQPLVLGIETSCDETGVGIVRGETLLVDAIASSVDEHARFGGVVPEVASRAHLEAMVPTIERASPRGRRRARPTSTPSPSRPGPGLAGALMVGVAAAKSLAVALGVPALRRQPPRVPRRRRHRRARPAARADPGDARLRRALVAAARARRHPRHPVARLDDRRRRGRGVRQGGAGARAAVPRWAAHRPDGARGRPGRDRLPARADHRARHGAATGSTSRSPGSRPRWPGGCRPARRRGSRCRWPTSPRRSRRRSPTC